VREREPEEREAHVGKEARISRSHLTHERRGEDGAETEAEEVIGEAPKERKTREKRHEEEEVGGPVRALPLEEREGPEDEELQGENDGETRAGLRGHHAGEKPHELIEEAVVRKQVRDILRAREGYGVREARQHGTDGHVLRIIDEGRECGTQEKQRENERGQPIGGRRAVLHEAPGSKYPARVLAAPA
jgi:hypothetical protein